MMKPSPSQPEYYGWYPDATIPAAFAKGLDRNDVVIKNCKFYYIGGYYPDYVYADGEARTGTVLSWRGTEGSGVDARGLQFVKNYIENSGRTLIGFESGPYSDSIHRDAFISQNTWVNCEVIQFANQLNSVLTKNKIIGTNLAVVDCNESQIFDNQKIASVQFSGNEDVLFYGNTLDDSELTSVLGLISGGNTRLSVYNNSFTFKFRPASSPSTQTWQFSDMYDFTFENNRIEVVNAPTSTTPISFRTAIDGLTLNQNTFINCYLIFRSGELVFTGTNNITNNTIVNNAMASSTRVLENTASGPYTASGNEVVNGTYLGTLNNA